MNGGRQTILKRNGQLEMSPQNITAVEITPTKTTEITKKSTGKCTTGKRT